MRRGIFPLAWFIGAIILLRLASIAEGCVVATQTARVRAAELANLASPRQHSALVVLGMEINAVRKDQERWKTDAFHLITYKVPQDYKFLRTHIRQSPLTTNRYSCSSLNPFSPFDAMVSAGQVTNKPGEHIMLLSASYKTPHDSFRLHSQIPAPPTSSVDDKTTYLAALRRATAQIQDDVNRELTQRMEEDKARAVSAQTGVDDAKEEENYGEEVVEDEN
ncbi:hypothetical protein ACRALDRAFT_212218 [Sodiomyces alcalophilus JCM 7366]|uniref:uncharacterized protein n=1 Tax=Sodiomyces alcalophilus JCM 7366 TaxID=591952 RepID=UPI0039B6E5E2